MNLNQRKDLNFVRSQVKAYSSGLTFLQVVRMTDILIWIQQCNGNKQCGMTV